MKYLLRYYMHCLGRLLFPKGNLQDIIIASSMFYNNYYYHLQILLLLFIIINIINGIITIVTVN